MSLLLALYKAAIVAVDGWAAFVGPHPSLPYRKDADVDSDKQLEDLCNSLPREDWLDPSKGGNRPARLTPDVIGKFVPRRPTGWPSDAIAQELVRNRTNIPVPPIRRVFPIGEYSSMIVMDYIPGRTLAAAWPTMSFLQKIRTAITLRSYVRQLRSITHPRSHIPGPLIEGKDPVRCYSCIFGTRYNRGPFHTSANFIDFFNCAMDEAAAAGLCSHKGALKDEGLVFTHVDFAPRNIIIGDDGQLWLIDFGYAGFYPKWFEYVNMRLDDLLGFGKEYDTVWCNLIPFVCDPYFDIYDWIGTIAPDYLP